MLLPSLTKKNLAWDFLRAATMNAGTAGALAAGSSAPAASSSGTPDGGAASDGEASDGGTSEDGGATEDSGVTLVPAGDGGGCIGDDAGVLDLLSDQSPIKFVVAAPNPIVGDWQGQGGYVA